MVGEAPVDLLRHPRVEAAQPGLDVGHGDAQLGRGQGSGQGRVRVAHDDHQRGCDLLDHLLERLQHAARHPPVGAGADAEMAVGARERQLLEEGVRHLAVVVLAGVDDHLPHVAPQRAGERPQLDELRPRADDGQDSRRGRSVAGRRVGARGGRRERDGAGGRRPGEPLGEGGTPDGFNGPDGRAPAWRSPRPSGLSGETTAARRASSTSGGGSSLSTIGSSGVAWGDLPAGRLRGARSLPPRRDARARPHDHQGLDLGARRVEHERVVEPQPLEDAQDGLGRGPAAELHRHRRAGRRALVDDLHARLAREAVEHLGDRGLGGGDVQAGPPDVVTSTPGLQRPWRGRAPARPPSAKRPMAESVALQAAVSTPPCMRYSAPQDAAARPLALDLAA